MCERSDVLREVQNAANALTRACLCQIEAISVSLHHAYDPHLGDPMPAGMAALLAQLGADPGTT